MRKQVLSALCVLVFLTLHTTKASGQEQPRLVVFVSVDQMRADYVDRFSELFTGGLNRLLAEAPGHRGSALRNQRPRKNVRRSTCPTIRW